MDYQLQKAVELKGTLPGKLLGEALREVSLRAAKEFGCKVSYVDEASEWDLGPVRRDTRRPNWAYTAVIYLNKPAAA
ncbi:MAG: hypothetical protein EB059_06630 [Alphaproteobacteria bacterium]|nr:hypothetical protein [Alphaproteobacteria bacterium]